MGSIAFFKEGVRFRLNRQTFLKRWITAAFRANKVAVKQVNFIFCSDRYLLKLNKDFLRHHYFTDVITFDNSEGDGKKEADIFISVDRVLVNSKKFGTKFSDELHRVMIHGTLHLMGYSDKNSKGRERMREQEDRWLSRRKFS